MDEPEDWRMTPLDDEILLVIDDFHATLYDLQETYGISDSAWEAKLDEWCVNVDNYVTWLDNKEKSDG